MSGTAGSYREKLQRVEGALGKNISELLEMARKVYVDRDKAEKKEKDARMHSRMELLAVALQEGMTMNPSKRGTMLGPNQCVYCKGEGHWHRACLKKMMRGRGIMQQPDVRSGFGARGGLTQDRFPGRGGEKGGRGFGRAFGQTTRPQEREMLGLAEVVCNGTETPMIGDVLSSISTWGQGVGYFGLSPCYRNCGIQTMNPLDMGGGSY
ncbi:hypothetical protein E2320_010828 [Naja naja]|nr:hypothetical protein E2320_010828 [Naja naja]